MIKIFITGGTIDDIDYELLEDAPKNSQSYIPEKLKSARLSVKYSTEVLMMKDSRHITDEDRELILKKCQAAEAEKIIITHGTMAMPITAKALGSQITDKTIVLVGSATPINKSNSEALLNIGAAIAAVQLLPFGVYVSMNGKIFSWDNVTKNLETGYFEMLK